MAGSAIVVLRTFATRVVRTGHQPTVHLATSMPSRFRVSHTFAGTVNTVVGGVDAADVLSRFAIAQLTDVGSPVDVVVVGRWGVGTPSSVSCVQIDSAPQTIGALRGSLMIGDEPGN